MNSTDQLHSFVASMIWFVVVGFPAAGLFGYCVGWYLCRKANKAAIEFRAEAISKYPYLQAAREMTERNATIAAIQRGEFPVEPLNFDDSRRDPNSPAQQQRRKLEQAVSGMSFEPFANVAVADFKEPAAYDDWINKGQPGRERPFDSADERREFFEAIAQPDPSMGAIDPQEIRAKELFAAYRSTRQDQGYSVPRWVDLPDDVKDKWRVVAQIDPSMGATENVTRAALEFPPNPPNFSPISSDRDVIDVSSEAARGSVGKGIGTVTRKTGIWDRPIAMMNNKPTVDDRARRYEGFRTDPVFSALQQFEINGWLHCNDAITYRTWVKWEGWKANVDKRAAELRSERRGYWAD